MKPGIVQSVEIKKGFGFIRPADGTDDVFFHRSAFQGRFDDLIPGMPVSFEEDPQSERRRAQTVAPQGPLPGRRATKRPEHCEKGFVTKLIKGEAPGGYISHDQGGAEIHFEWSVVLGPPWYAEIRVGDYVEFTRDPAADNPRQPVANFVRKIERTIRLPQTQLSRHPKSRGKKPSWR